MITLPGQKWKIIHLVLGISLALLCNHCLLGEAVAQTYSGESFPKDFKYQNRPIDPLCVEKLSLDDMARASAVNIDECSKHPDYQISKVNDDLTRKGFMGYDYSYKQPNGFEVQGMSYYRYLGKVNDNHLIYSMQNGGGSGFPTFILLVERLGNKLRLLKEVAGGDRCNGGIDPNVQLKGKLVSYKASVTPYDVIALSDAMSSDLQAYDDLAACAACCLGEATFEYDLSNDAARPKLTSLTFGKDAGSDEAHTQGKLQSCFNKVLRDFTGKNKNLKLSADQLNEFAKQFNTNCVK